MIFLSNFVVFQKKNLTFFSEFLQTKKSNTLQLNSTTLQLNSTTQEWIALSKFSATISSTLPQMTSNYSRTWWNLCPNTSTMSRKRSKLSIMDQVSIISTTILRKSTKKRSAISKTTWKCSRNCQNWIAWNKCLWICEFKKTISWFFLCTR